MRGRINRWWSLLPALSLAGTAVALAEFGIEGMGVVSTRSTEIRASVSPDGTRIVWGSPDREGGPGGWDLWQATRRDGRWQDARPLPLDTPAKEFDPAFSADGRWLYFFSDRPGGRGGDDLYRAAALGDGGFGAAENLGPGVNSAGDEWAPAPSRDGEVLMFASNGFGGAGRHDVFVARWNGTAFVDARAVPGVNTADDDFDAVWLDDGTALVFARSADAGTQPIRLYTARCDGARYADIAPLALSFNRDGGWTLGPAVDWNAPGELLVSGAAEAPKAGGLDIYRMKAPALHGARGCR